MATRQTPAVATTTQTTEIVDTLNPFRSKIEFETAQRMAALFAQSPWCLTPTRVTLGHVSLHSTWQTEWEPPPSW